MSSKLIGILFLILVPLFIIGMIAALVYNIVSGNKSNKEIAELAKSYNWEYFAKQNTELDNILKETLYISEGERAKRKTTNIIKGNYKQMNFWFAFYVSKAKTPGTQRELTFVRNWNIFVVPVKYSGENFMLLNLRGALKHLPIEKLSKMIGQPLIKPQQEELQNFLTDKPEAISQLNMNNQQLNVLTQVLSEAHSIHFFQNYFIYAIDNNKELIKNDELIQYLDKIVNLQELFK